jgi:mannosyltransferase OCH1-like enzyme
MAIDVAARGWAAKLWGRRMIPKVIHQIWINEESPELPEKWARLRDTWVELHPDWEYRLWNLDNLDFEVSHVQLIEQAPNYAQISDVLRYQVLYHHGGVYVDTDFECLRPFDELLAGVRNFASSEDGRFVGNAILGAEPKSTYMERVLQSLPEQIGLENAVLETGPRFLTKVLMRGGMGSDFVMFPTSHFFPYRANEPEKAAGPFPDSYAVHHWAHTWDDAREYQVRTRARRRLRRVIAAARGN